MIIGHLDKIKHSSGFARHCLLACIVVDETVTESEEGNRAAKEPEVADKTFCE